MLSRQINGPIGLGGLLPDEIFGAIGGLTGTPRSATVVATKQTTVVVLPTDHFIELIQERPQTVLQLVKDMARKLVSLNERVVSLEDKRS